jgi:tRNA G10  N-methylase Trm11
MSQSIVILGRQPALGLAELESLYGTGAIRPVGSQAALLDAAPESLGFNRLGSCIKLARLLSTLETTDWPKLERQLRRIVVDNLQYIPEGKIKLGLSLYGFDISASKLNASALSLKKAVRAAGRSVRIVPNNELQLNSAQVLHNGLTSPTGLELLLIRDGDTTLLAQTVHEQDIEAYAARDQGRPKRDARVGMLPPKLAQTIINLAAANSAPASNVILDPFCGTGVILQEALLMGYGVYGSDVEPRMVDFSTKNLEWLHGNYQLIDAIQKVEAGDATSHIWNPAPTIVACEGYLGQPFNSLPSPEKLADVRATCHLILRKFLQNIGGQLKSGTRLCLAVPAWQTRPGQFQHLATLDHLEELGYNRVSFKHVRAEDLIYARADQIVARELLVLIKN